MCQSLAGPYPQRLPCRAARGLEILLGVLRAASRAAANCSHNVAGHGALRRFAAARSHRWPPARMQRHLRTQLDSTLGGPDSQLCIALRTAYAAGRCATLALETRRTSARGGLESRPPGP